MTQEEFNKMLRRAIDERVIYIKKDYIKPITYGPCKYDYVITYTSNVIQFIRVFIVPTRFYHLFQPYSIPDFRKFLNQVDIFSPKTYNDDRNRKTCHRKYCPPTAGGL